MILEKENKRPSPRHLIPVRFPSVPTEGMRGVNVCYVDGNVKPYAACGVQI